MKTDLDLYETIRDAYEFQNNKPHLSLLSSRLIGEFIALEVGDRAGKRKTEDETFRAYLNRLADQKVLTMGERNRFHQLVSLGSEGAHNRTRNSQSAVKALELAMGLAKQYTRVAPRNA